MPTPDHLFQHRLAPQYIGDEGRHQPAQVEASDEPVGEGGQVGLAIPSVGQRMEGVGQRCLQVAQHGVDPLELGQVLRLESSHYMWCGDAAPVGDTVPAVTEA
jgi:hypothetical protein